MTLIGVAPPATTATATRVTELATWSARAGALGLDVLPGIAVLSTAALTALSVPLHGGWWWGCVCVGVVAVLWMGFNRLLLPGSSGQSLGRAMFGIAVVHRDGSPVVPVRLTLREAAHLLDTAALFTGWLWPLKDSRRRTFADIVLNTEAQVVVAKRTAGRARRRAATLVLSAAALCALEAAVSYTVVYQQNQSIAHVSADIAAQGPRVVEQILSYHPESLQGDFDRARSLATDSYRVQLTAQQVAVQKAHPVRNEYWVTNSSVLSAAEGHATMLLFLQGVRGAAPDQRYLTASVRVRFVQSASGSWRVDDVSVVTNPQPVAAKP